MRRSKKDIYYLDLNPFVTYPKWFQLLPPKIKKDTKWKGLLTKSLLHKKVDLNVDKWASILSTRQREYNSVILTYTPLYPLMYEIVREKLSDIGLKLSKGRKGI